MQTLSICFCMLMILNIDSELINNQINHARIREVELKRQN